jgi:hypothetical protein
MSPPSVAQPASNTAISAGILMDGVIRFHMPEFDSNVPEKVRVAAHRETSLSF